MTSDWGITETMLTLLSKMDLLIINWNAPAKNLEQILSCNEQIYIMGVIFYSSFFSGFSLKSQCRSNDFLEALKQSTTRLHCYVNNKDHKIKFPLHFKQGSTLCIGDLDKLNLMIWWFDYRLQPTFANVQAASKMQLTSKVVISHTKIIISLILYQA